MAAPCFAYNPIETYTRFFGVTRAVCSWCSYRIHTPRWFTSAYLRRAWVDVDAVGFRAHAPIKCEPNFQYQSVFRSTRSGIGHRPWAPSTISPCNRRQHIQALALLELVQTPSHLPPPEIVAVLSTLSTRRARQQSPVVRQAGAGIARGEIAVAPASQMLRHEILRFYRQNGRRRGTKAV